MSLPYGENEGDIWTGEGSEVQARMDRENPGTILLHEMIRRQDGTVEEAIFATQNPALIAKGRMGDKVFGTVLCPRCERERFVPYGGELRPTDDFSLPALSRIDNQTYVCTPCGQDEAMRDYAGEPPVPPDQWPIGMREAGEFGMGGRFA